MGTNSSKGNLILVVILAILLVTVLVVKNKPSAPPISPEVAMTVAGQNILSCSPTASATWKDISALQRENKLDLTIKDDDLGGNTLGQTSITVTDNKVVCVIIIDSGKATKSGDKIEPLLGHELKHVWDALFMYDKKNPIVSAENFIATVYRDKEMVHNSREVELSAIAYEDKVRLELLKSGNTAFNGMPNSRAMADIRFTNKSKLDPSLKKALLD